MYVLYALRGVIMAIPADILAVERPSSTRVKQSGNRYLVIKRTSKRVNGRTVPVELGTIGEIVDGKYIELRDKPRKKRNSVDIKDYGEFALFHKAAGNLLSELNEAFDAKTAKTLLVIALLRATDPDIKNRDLKFVYDTSYISEVFPGISLSENTVSKFLMETGMAYRYIQQFMRNRVKKYSGNTLVIDGTLKSSNGSENSFSEFSRKGHIKGSMDLNLLYAYDIESQEPVAVKPYPGNMLDLTAVDDFIQDYAITHALLVMDKGFYSKSLIEKLRKADGINYIIPLKQSSKLIDENNMLEAIVSPLDGYSDATVFYKKTKVNDSCYLYAFRNPKTAAEQESGYLTYSRKKGTFSEDKLLAKQNEFGVIVFQTNADISPLAVYEAYAKRWEIEVMFSMYKGIIDLDTVNVHSDYSIYTTELINYLSVIISMRVKHILKTTPLSKSNSKNGAVKMISDLYSFRQIMRYLSKAKMVRVGDSDKWVPSQTVKYINDLMNALSV